MKTLTIEWLNKCRCGNKLHTVKTARGNESALWDDDAVKCDSCGRGGVIQICEGQARVLWETDEEMAEGKPMSTISKEWLQQKISDMEATRDEIPFGLDEDDSNTLAALRIALASLEAKAVAYVIQDRYERQNDHLGHLSRSHATKYVSDDDIQEHEITCTPLYTTPPAPVCVPDELADAVNGLLDAMDEYPESLVPINRDSAVVRQLRAAMLQGAEPVTTAYKLQEETGSSLQVRNLIRQRHAEWSQATFGDVGPVGPLMHLSKEALEAAAEPDDLSEWADMQFLLWDAQRRAGISDGEITAAMEEKLKVNMARQWPEPKDGEPRLHIKETPQQEVK